MKHPEEATSSDAPDSLGASWTMSADTSNCEHEVEITL
jgi:hypothetical protein